MSPEGIRPALPKLPFDITYQDSVELVVGEENERPKGLNGIRETLTAYLCQFLLFLFSMPGLPDPDRLFRLRESPRRVIDPATRWKVSSLALKNVSYCGRAVFQITAAGSVQPI